MPSNRVDLGSPTANMYGCEPCPNCGDKYRCMFNERPGVIQCDHCGYDEDKEICGYDEDKEITDDDTL